MKTIATKYVDIFHTSYGDFEVYDQKTGDTVGYILYDEKEKHWYFDSSGSSKYLGQLKEIVKFMEILEKEFPEGDWRE